MIITSYSFLQTIKESFSTHFKMLSPTTKKAAGVALAIFVLFSIYHVYKKFHKQDKEVLKITITNDEKILVNPKDPKDILLCAQKLCKVFEWTYNQRKEFILYTGQCNAHPKFVNFLENSVDISKTPVDSTIVLNHPNDSTNILKNPKKVYDNKGLVVYLGIDKSENETIVSVKDGKIEEDENHLGKHIYWLKIDKAMVMEWDNDTQIENYKHKLQPKPISVHPQGEEDKKTLILEWS